VLAVGLAVADHVGNPGRLALAVLPALAGVGTAWQQAVNGQVRVASGNALTATAVNFAVGTAALMVALAVDLAVRGMPTGGWPREPWLYLGGPIGIVFIAVAAVVVRFTGVLLLGLATIAGQVVGAVLLDLVAPPAAGRPGPFTLLGAALTLVAVGVAALRPIRR
jgi:transporter family-2 protein